MFQSVNAWEKWKTNIRTKIKCCNHLEICVGDGSFFFNTKPLIISQVKDAFVFWKLVFKKLFFKFFCVCLPLKSWLIENTFRLTKNIFQSKENLTWFTGKCFPFILGEKHFPEVVKNLEMLYYLLIISNLIFKFLIVSKLKINIYFLKINMNIENNLHVHKINNYINK
jgi:hypothetical protein